MGDEISERTSHQVVVDYLEGYMQKLGFGATQSGIMAQFIVSRLAVLADKRQDYGTANISMTGLPGVAVRLLDKAARLWNLQTRKAKVTGETNTDTVGDIMGYSLIAAVLLEGEEW